MYAVIKTGGKQYRVQAGDSLSVEKLDVETGEMFNFDQVLLIEDGDKVIVGTPFIENAVVRAEVVENYKDDKVLVFKKKRRKQYRRTRGHRQPLTRVLVESIIADVQQVPAEELKAVKAKPKAVPEEKAPPAAAPAEVPVEKAPQKKTAVKEAKPKKPASEAKPEAKKKAAPRAAAKPKKAKEE
ncbi:MAG TPA: 50S ribosomal protein L21 [Candidatus Aminicenantes bacterium]|nr:50S ribosomal protein L21 [Candidatus Aminicenantes bacterium]